MCQTRCKILFVYFLIESDSNYLKGKSVMSQDRGKKKNSPSVALKMTLSSP